MHGLRGVFCRSQTTSVLLKAAQKPIHALANADNAGVVFTFRSFHLSFLGWDYPFERQNVLPVSCSRLWAPQGRDDV